MADKAFEVFIRRAIVSIAKEEAGWTRSSNSKELREACNVFLSQLEEHEKRGSIARDTEAHNASISIAAASLHPLSIACASSNNKVVELALGSLHKLVAHAWLQGESQQSEGLLDDRDSSDVVQLVIKAVVKVGESASTKDEGCQLAVVRALLTFVTAEHFIAHGDCLMAAIRTVFNLALGSTLEIIKRTACNALLQVK